MLTVKLPMNLGTPPASEVMTVHAGIPWSHEARVKQLFVPTLLLSAGYSSINATVQAEPF